MSIWERKIPSARRDKPKVVTEILRVSSSIELHHAAGFEAHSSGFLSKVIVTVCARIRLTSL